MHKVLQVPSRGTTVQQVVPQQPMETTLEHVIFSEGLQNLGKTHAWNRESVRKKSSRKKLFCIDPPITLPTVPLRMGRGKR